MPEGLTQNKLFCHGNVLVVALGEVNWRKSETVVVTPR